MDMRSKREKALSVVAAATIAASLGAPATALADEANQGQEGASMRLDAFDSYGLASTGDNEAVGSGTATVISEDGVRTSYDTFTKACSNAPAYSKVVLNQSVVLDKYVAEVKAFGVTIDLNGYSIDGSAYSGSKAVVTMSPKYGQKPIDGKDNTLRIVNSRPESGGVIKGTLPVEGKCGNSLYEAPLFIDDTVELETSNGGLSKVKLASSGYLVYSEKSASYMENGGFKVQAADGTQRIYGSSGSAAAASQVGTPIVLMNNYTGGEALYSGNHSFIIDLDGHTYTYTGTDNVININYDGAGISVMDGAIKATNPLTGAGVSMLYSNCSFSMDGVTMDIPGDSWGIGSNGTEENNRVLLKDSTMNVGDGLGIYFPCTGVVSIEDSAINARHFGVQMCAGELNVSGSDTSIVATGAVQQKTDNDGPIIDGAAVSIVEREGYKDLGSVNVSGGSFVAAPGVPAMKAYAFNNADKIEGEWPQAGDCVNISAGSFSKAPDYMARLCAEGYELVEGPDGSCSVELSEEKRVVEIEGVYYPTLTAALSAVQDGQTIKLLKEKAVEDAPIVFAGNKSIVLDLNGGMLDMGSHQIVVDDGSKLTVVGDGVLTNSSTLNAIESYVIYGKAGSDVVLDGVSVKGAYGLYAMGDSVVKRANFNISGGCAIAVNGTAQVVLGDSNASDEDNARNVTVVSANNCISTQAGQGSVDSRVVVYGGTFTAGIDPDNPSNPWNSGPVYWASHGALDIKGGVFKADVDAAAVFQKNGSVEISGGAFESKDGFKIDATQADTSEIETEITGGIFKGTRSAFYSNAGSGSIDYARNYSVKVSGGDFVGGSEGAVYVKEGGVAAAGKRALEITGGTFSSNPSVFVADGYKANESNGKWTVSAIVPPTPPAPAPDTEVEQRPDGSTVTTVTNPDGSQTVTTEAADGSQSVVSKDADGNVTSTEVSVSDKAAEAGEVVLPLDPSKPAADAGEAPAVEVKLPASVTAEAPVKVTVPVDADEPDYGVVVFAVDADGNETVLPKCGVDADGNAVFEATGDVTIKVVDAASEFPDVAGTWYGKQGVADFVSARGILTGVPQADGALRFEGDAATTRAMFVTMLHRAESCPDAEGAGFDDAAGLWFEEAAAWGEATGVVDGYGGSAFGGDDSVTREQMAVFLMRYAEHLGLDTSARADLSEFPDGSEASPWASRAMSWAVAEGLFSGRDGRLDPTDGATRAEASAVVMRFINGMYA